MRKNEFVERMCIMATLVGNKRFGSEIEHDCICTDSIHQKTEHAIIHRDIACYIEVAVQERLNKSPIVRQRLEAQFASKENK